MENGCEHKPHGNAVPEKGGRTLSQLLSMHGAALLAIVLLGMSAIMAVASFSTTAPITGAGL